MNEFGLTFHHLGLAVKKPEGAYRYLTGLGYRLGAEAFDPLQRVHLAMAWHPAMPDVEVIWPGAEPSPLDGLLTRNGSLVYHMCYLAPDPVATLAAMATAGLKVVSLEAPQPAVLFGGREVSFHQVVGVGLIELIHGGPEAVDPAS